MGCSCITLIPLFNSSSTTILPFPPAIVDFITTQATSHIDLSILFISVYKGTLYFFAHSFDQSLPLEKIPTNS